MTPLTITTRDATTGPIWEIAGELDHVTAPRLRTAADHLTLAAGHLLVLDLAGLQFCDSSGITALLAARNMAIEQGGDIVLAAVPAHTARTLNIVGLDQVFAIYPDTDAATASAAPPPRPTRTDGSS